MRRKARSGLAPPGAPWRTLFAALLFATAAQAEPPERLRGLAERAEWEPPESLTAVLVRAGDAPTLQSLLGPDMLVLPGDVLRLGEDLAAETVFLLDERARDAEVAGLRMA